jgi:hypothetical protein
VTPPGSPLPPSAPQVATIKTLQDRTEKYWCARSSGQGGQGAQLGPGGAALPGGVRLASRQARLASRQAAFLIAPGASIAIAIPTRNDNKEELTKAGVTLDKLKAALVTVGHSPAAAEGEGAGVLGAGALAAQSTAGAAARAALRARGRVARCYGRAAQRGRGDWFPQQAQGLVKVARNLPTQPPLRHRHFCPPPWRRPRAPRS